LVVTAENRDLKIVNVENNCFEQYAFNSHVTVAKWHPRHPSKILIGSVKGEIRMYDLEKKAFETDFTAFFNPKLEKKDSNSVVDLAWSPGEDVFLALFKNGQLRLYGQHEIGHKMEFETQSGGGVSKACWVDNVSGDFITSSARVGAIKIWNASQPQHKEMIKVSRHGISSIVACQRYHFLM